MAAPFGCFQLLSELLLWIPVPVGDIPIVVTECCTCDGVAIQALVGRAWIIRQHNRQRHIVIRLQHSSSRCLHTSLRMNRR